MFSKIKALFNSLKIQGEARKIADRIKQFIEASRQCESYLATFGLKNFFDYQIKIAEEEDYEVEGWRYLVFKIEIKEEGKMKLLEKGIDRFYLLKQLTSIIKKILPEATVLIEEI
jgi:hypothetical protein